MKTPLLLPLALLALGVPASAQTQAAQTQAAQTQAAQTQPAPAQTAAPSPWTHATLQAATYLVLPPVLEGNPATLDPAQRASVLSAMARDLQGAVLRRYPAAKFVTSPQTSTQTPTQTPGVVTLRPVLNVPGSLLPWNSFQARVELALNGSTAVIQDSFGVLEVYSHRADAANYLFDRLVAKLP